MIKKGLGVLGRAFRKLGGIMISQEALSIARIATLAVPVAPVALGIAIEKVSEAERHFRGKLRGEEKLQWALANAYEALRDQGIEEKRIRGLIELALLVIKDEARVTVED